MKFLANPAWRRRLASITSPARLYLAAGSADASSSKPCATSSSQRSSPSMTASVTSSSFEPKW
jgi:hypothetical protein